VIGVAFTAPVNATLIIAAASAVVSFDFIMVVTPLQCASRHDDIYVSEQVICGECSSASKSSPDKVNGTQTATSRRGSVQEWPLL